MAPGLKTFILNILLAIGALVLKLYGPDLPPEIRDALSPEQLEAVVNAGWLVYTWVAIIANFIMRFFTKGPPLEAIRKTPPRR